MAFISKAKTRLPRHRMRGAAEWAEVIAEMLMEVALAVACLVDEGNQALGQPPPVVVLGRDALPLVPVLYYQHGIPATYFFVARAEAVKRPGALYWRWKREVPPGAIVIDTGFGGSIFNALRHMDPHFAYGGLMASAGLYPQLATGDRVRAVDVLEDWPKAHPRVATYAQDGTCVYEQAWDVPSDSGEIVVPEDYERALGFILRAARVPTGQGMPWEKAGFGHTVQERLWHVADVRAFMAQNLEQRRALAESKPTVAQVLERALVNGEVPSDGWIWLHMNAISVIAAEVRALKGLAPLMDRALDMPRLREHDYAELDRIARAWLRQMAAGSALFSPHLKHELIEI